MAAKLPPDLSPDWWSKNKAKTLKPTGFGKALKAYEDAKAAVKGGKTSPLAGFKAVVDAADGIRAARDKAEKACMPKMHDDTKEALKAYTKLLTVDAAKYVKLLSESEKALTACEGLAKKTTADVDKIMKSLGVINKNYETTRKAMADAVAAADKKKVVGLLKLGADFDKRVAAYKAAYATAKKSLNDALNKPDIDARDTLKVPAIAESQRLNGPMENQLAAAETHSKKLKEAAKSIASGSA